MERAVYKKRERLIEKLITMAKHLAKKYTYDEYHKMWSMCSDWNSNHEEAEIFMCEDEDENGTFRYYIEDDYFYLAS